jgi:hypothetical protein
MDAAAAILPLGDIAQAIHAQLENIVTY